MYTCTTSVSSANTCGGLSEGLAAAEAVTMTAADVVSKSAAKVTYMAMTKASCSAAKVVKAVQLRRQSHGHSRRRKSRRQSRRHRNSRRRNDAGWAPGTDSWFSAEARAGYKAADRW